MVIFIISEDSDGRVKSELRSKVRWVEMLKYHARRRTDRARKVGHSIIDDQIASSETIYKS